MGNHWMEGDVPAWYKLRVHSESTFSISVHTKAVKGVWHHLEPSSYLVTRRLKEESCLSPFRGSSREGRFGFGGALSLATGIDTNWTTYRGSLPPAGKPRETQDLIATLRVLFDALYVFEDRTDVENPQFLTITRFGDVRSSEERKVLQATIMPAGCRWVREWQHAPWPNIKNAMYGAVKHMRRGYTSYIDHDITKLDACRLRLALPEAAVFIADEVKEPADNTCTLCTQGVRKPWQQLAFFMALCYLQQAMRGGVTKPMPAIRL